MAGRFCICRAIGRSLKDPLGREMEEGTSPQSIECFARIVDRARASAVRVAAVWVTVGAAWIQSPTHSAKHPEDVVVRIGVKLREDGLYTAATIEE